MKFLVLAMCVCAASAASFGYQPRQYKPVQTYQPIQPAQAFASAVVTESEAIYRTVKQPFVKADTAPETVAYNAPVAVAKSAAYTAPVTVAKPAVYTVPNAGDKDVNAAILRSESEVAADSYNYLYETANGIAAQASGSLKNVDNTDTLVSQGSYQYVDPNGVTVQVSYIADENGYQPKSDSLPVGPEIPAAILRSLEYIRTHAPAKSERV